MRDKLLFFIIYASLWPYRFFSHKTLYRLGKLVGTLSFYLCTRYRKRALSNLALATTLQLSPKEIKKIAKQSFHSLCTTLLEYPKFSYAKDLSSSFICENPDYAETLISKKQGVIFFCGHQANWEVLFLEGTQRMPGVAIGRPVKNHHLYAWILKIRQRFGGKMITPSNAIRAGFRALKQGKFLGIVGDQGMPDSGFVHPFLGRRAWTSPAPALLAYKTNSPIIVATTHRKQGKYHIHYSDPIWPDITKPLEEEVSTMMQKTLQLFEKSIIQCPEQWLWVHNRWKQETPKNVYYRYRYDSILICLPQDPAHLKALLPCLSTFRAIYPLAFITVATPSHVKISIPDTESIYYHHEKELLFTDYRYKLIFNFSANTKVKRHFLKQSAMLVLSLTDLYKAAKPHLTPTKDYPIEEILKRALCRPNTLWSSSHAS